MRFLLDYCYRIAKITTETREAVCKVWSVDFKGSPRSPFSTRYLGQAELSPSTSTKTAYHKKSRVDAEMSTQLFSIKPDIQEICKI